MGIDPLIAVVVGALIALVIGERMARAAQREKDRKEDMILAAMIRERRDRQRAEWERRRDSLALALQREEETR